MTESTTTTPQQVLAIAEAVKAREQIVKDVMSEIPKEDRGKLMNLVIIVLSIVRYPSLIVSFSFPSWLGEMTNQNPGIMNLHVVD